MNAREMCREGVECTRRLARRLDCVLGEGIYVARVVTCGCEAARAFYTAAVGEIYGMRHRRSAQNRELSGQVGLNLAVN
jgi:hypothetical protein